MTKAKKASHTFQPTPVLCAIRSIRFMVPLSLLLVFENWSFIFSASAVESRISSPMRRVSCRTHQSTLYPSSLLSLRYMPLTSFNMPTFLLISDTCSSFCDSNSESTASLKAPRLSGVAVRKLAPEPPLSGLLPGYAANVLFEDEGML